MVLEKVSEEMLSRRKWLDAFLNGFLMALVGTILAIMFFPANVGIVAVFLSSLALMPSIRRMISVTEMLEGRHREIGKKNLSMIEFSVARQELNPFHLVKDNRMVFEVYGFIFLGMIACFALVFLALPQQTVEILFRNQLALQSTGQALSTAQALAFFLENNFYVLLVSFIIALLFAEGAVLIVSWNSAYWAAVIVLLAHNIGLASNQNPIIPPALLFITILPHMYLEMLAYLSAIIAGALLSKAASKERLFGERFNHIMVDALIIFIWAAVLLVAAAWVETFIAPESYKLLFS